MRKLFIEVNESAFRQLQERAAAERRDVRDEAALLLERVLDDARRGTAPSREPIAVG